MLPNFRNEFTDWLDRFVFESNQIDPQPGHLNVAEDKSFEGHRHALGKAVMMGINGKLSHPCYIHKDLMRGLKGISVGNVGAWRKVGVVVTDGANSWSGAKPGYLPRVMMNWMTETGNGVTEMKSNGSSDEDKVKAIWEWHVKFEQIHPFIDGNGRTGRIIMANHALAMGIEPWIVEFKDVGEYYKRFEHGR